jgi:hypothetical protein
MYFLKCFSSKSTTKISAPVFIYDETIYEDPSRNIAPRNIGPPRNKNTKIIDRNTLCHHDHHHDEMGEPEKQGRITLDIIEDIKKQIKEMNKEMETPPIAKRSPRPMSRTITREMPLKIPHVATLF